MTTYAISHALSCLNAGMMEIRQELGELDRVVKGGTAAPAPSPVPASSSAAGAVDVHAMRASIELGLRTSIKASLHADLQQALKDDRQLTESSLMVRYDAMVCRIVKDQVTAAAVDLRSLVESLSSEAQAQAQMVAQAQAQAQAQVVAQVVAQAQAVNTPSPPSLPPLVQGQETLKKRPAPRARATIGLMLAPLLQPKAPPKARVGTGTGTGAGEEADAPAALRAEGAVSFEADPVQAAEG